MLGARQQLAHLLEDARVGVSHGRRTFAAVTYACLP
jgi:hypothetical protein